MTRHLSFESFLSRWAWVPGEKLRTERPNADEIAAIKASFHGDPDLVISYVDAVTDNTLGEGMWGENTPVFYPDAVGAVIITPCILGQDASAPDAVTWGKLTRSHIHTEYQPLMLRSEARSLIRAGVPGEFADALVRSGVDATEIGELWRSGVPMDYIIAARSAL